MFELYFFEFSLPSSIPERRTDGRTVSGGDHRRIAMFRYFKTLLNPPLGYILIELTNQLNNTNAHF